MLDKKKMLLIGAVLIGGYFLYRGTRDPAGPISSGADSAGSGAASPYYPAVIDWAKQTGPADYPLWQVAIDKMSSIDIGKLHTIIYEIWAKNIDPYKYFFDAAHTETAGDWFMSVKALYNLP